MNTVESVDVEFSRRRADDTAIRETDDFRMIRNHFVFRFTTVDPT